MNDPRIPYGRRPSGPQGPQEPARGGGPERAPEHAVPDEYSATVLGSHWFDGPVGYDGPVQDDGNAPTVRLPRPVGAPVPTVRDAGPEVSGAGHADTVRAAAVPDRVEGSVLRFGPGVTAGAVHPAGITTTMVWHGGTPGGRGPGVPARPSRWAGLRRYTLAAVVLLAVLGCLAWQRFGPAVEVRSLTVAAPARAPGCDSAADVVAVVRTNGRPGTLSYRWVRNDGTRSEPLSERVARGQREARLHLLWSFRGQGVYRATAELELLSPQRRTAVAAFTYRCD
ncbi:hypothetical protein [Streptomyces sp. NRRL S-87]|uniref:hypothetical protein n=1 Tax=Streptomyces sp. NRRL S-87 TaxID=1463920 RepID=UPI00056C02D0|nr:hypothetical protein [Streptomyces sp. NRRL S-87]